MQMRQDSRTAALPSLNTATGLPERCLDWGAGLFCRWRGRVEWDMPEVLELWGVIEAFGTDFTPKYSSATDKSGKYKAP